MTGPYFRRGVRVVISDPLGYSGTGVVVAEQTRPHGAVLVRMDSITDRTDQSAAGREVWILTPYVTRHHTIADPDGVTTHKPCPDPSGRWFHTSTGACSCGKAHR